MISSIGVTTDIKLQRFTCERKCHCFRNWAVLSGPHTTMEEALGIEQKLAIKYNSVLHREEDVLLLEEGKEWFIYYFEHCGCSI